MVALEHDRIGRHDFQIRTAARSTSESFARFHHLLIGYWAIFWLMNGLDKFFNEPAFFGVTRDEKFIDYFSRIALPEPVALAALSAIGYYEVVLGLSFVIGGLAAARFGRLTLINLELSLAIFIFFSLGDVLFGDRRELWEHACYIVLIVLSYALVLVRQRALLSAASNTGSARPIPASWTP